jgi:hypothetical protein
MPHAVDIEQVEQHVREIEERITRQLAVIAQADESGLSTVGPKAFLSFLRASLSLSRDHLARLITDDALANGPSDNRL